MAINNILSKEQAVQIINDLPLGISIDTDYIYDVYEMANEAIQILDNENAQIEVKDVNQIELLLYCV